jgi:hypothetical protein
MHFAKFLDAATRKAFRQRDDTRLRHYSEHLRLSGNAGRRSLVLIFPTKDLIARPAGSLARQDQGP